MLSVLIAFVSIAGGVLTYTTTAAHGGHGATGDMPVIPALVDGEIQLTPDLDGRLVVVPAGEPFLVFMGVPYDWVITFDPPDTVRGVESAGVPVGSQGYYQIDTPGARTLLTADAVRFCPSLPDHTDCTPATGPHVSLTIVASALGATRVVTLGPGEDGAELTANVGDLIAIDLAEDADWSVDSTPVGILTPLFPPLEPPTVHQPGTPAAPVYFQVVGSGHVAVYGATPAPYYAGVTVQ